MTVYRWLLRLLPSSRRAQYGDDMARAFEELQSVERRRRGVLGVVVLWCREVFGLLKFAGRERTVASRTATEIRWAWRGVRARGWSAVLAVMLVGAAIAANALVFSIADSLVFHVVPYPDPERLVQIDVPRGPRTPAAPAMGFAEWSLKTNLFDGVAAFKLNRPTFLTGGTVAEEVRTADITPSTFAVLRVAPRWGRAFVNDDARLGGEVVVISESLAKVRFGKPALAVGQRLETTDRPLLVVGVMAESFHFVHGRVRIWRAVDASVSPQTFSLVARLPKDRTIDGTSAIVTPQGATVRAFSAGGVPDEQEKLVLMLVAAAACLLLTACANVASFELAAAIRRGRRYAIQLALGASRAALARAALLEGACLAGTALLLALICTHYAAGALANLLPDRFSFSALNPIDVDIRTIVFMTAVALATWLLSSLPVVFYASRASAFGLMKSEGHSSSRAGSTLRRVLTTFEIAMAVLLLTGSVLYVRTYTSMLRADKGFDSTALAVISLSVPPQMMADVPQVRHDLFERVRAMPGVVAATSDSPPPSSNTPSQFGDLDVDGRTLTNQDVRIGEKMVSEAYFRVMGIKLRAGRYFEPLEPASNVIIDASLARRYWPNGAVGGTIRLRGPQPLEVIGVVDHVRTELEGWTGPSTNEFLYYTLAPPRPPLDQQIASAQRWRGRSTGLAQAYIPLTVRLDSPDRAPEFFRQVRSMTPKFAMTADLVDDRYARWAETTLLATRVVGGFGVFAFLVAMAGVYGVMAYLVAGRTREIGIRMTLGADRANITRLVLGSSMRLVVTGALLGAAGAFAVSRWIESHLFGVSPSDPLTYVLVAVPVIFTAAIATWQPARQAAGVDPAVTLRAE